MNLRVFLQADRSADPSPQGFSGLLELLFDNPQVRPLSLLRIEPDQDINTAGVQNSVLSYQPLRTIRSASVTSR